MSLLSSACRMPAIMLSEQQKMPEMSGSAWSMFSVACMATSTVQSPGCSFARTRPVPSMPALKPSARSSPAEEPLAPRTMMTLPSPPSCSAMYSPATFAAAKLSVEIKVTYRSSWPASMPWSTSTTGMPASFAFSMTVMQALESMGFRISASTPELIRSSIWVTWVATPVWDSAMASTKVLPDASTASLTAV